MIFSCLKWNISKKTWVSRKTKNVKKISQYRPYFPDDDRCIINIIKYMYLVYINHSLTSHIYSLTYFANFQLLVNINEKKWICMHRKAFHVKSGINIVSIYMNTSKNCNGTLIKNIVISIPKMKLFKRLEHWSTFKA